MRQLAYFFRRAGATVIAGGSICTVFPEFAAQFFDAVCVGGVDAVRAVVADFERGTLKRIYRWPTTEISPYDVDYGLLATSKIYPTAHLVEASRGCTFRCSFCVMPSEAGGHSAYDTSAVLKAIESSIRASPPFSFRRWYPLILFLDNNFSDDHAHMLRVCELLCANPKVRGWAALVTQNILHDRKLVKTLAKMKCFALFVGLELLDPAMLRRYNKTQNLSRRYNIIEDIAFAESQGIGIGYGYLFDPRFQTATDMEQQICVITEATALPMPTYISVVAPLAGTSSFWADLAARQLASNLRLRDLDGETICYSKLADAPEAVVDFIEKIFRRPWTIVSRSEILLKTLRRLVRSGNLNPVRWYVMAQADLHCFVWSHNSPAQARTYLAGSEVLDPQYSEYPDDISADDKKRYFEPTILTDGDGGPAEWLKPYIPNAGLRPPPTAVHGETPERARINR